MCLFKTHEEPKIAQDDIEVWKILTYEGLSPYQDYQYQIGMNKPAEHSVIPVPVPVDQSQINGGYLHAYRNKEKAELNAFKYTRIIGVEHVVHKMLIPKGTAYYEGDDGDICAKCLYWPAEEAAVRYSHNYLYNSSKPINQKKI